MAEEWNAIPDDVLRNLVTNLILINTNTNYNFLALKRGILHITQSNGCAVVINIKFAKTFVTHCILFTITISYDASAILSSIFDVQLRFGDQKA